MTLPTLSASYKKVKMGVGSRLGDAILSMIGYQTDHYSISYSYDLTISKLAGNTRGSHEFQISYRFKSDENNDLRKGVDLIGF